MPAIAVAVVALVAFYLGYRFYSKYLAEKVYALDKSFVTPAHEFEDGVDYVPTNKHILFGHHFTSVAGLGPITGPAIAVFWGWLPALIWVVVGTIFAAGVHDFGAIVVSARNKAQNIGTLAQSVIHPRARTLFLIIIFFLLTLVTAVFVILMATLFVATPAAVIPSAVVIPIAIGIGQYVYRMRRGIVLPTVVGLLLLYGSIFVGQAFPITTDPLASALGLAPETVWVVLIMTYVWFAARLPVWMLLQPRDYINAYQLFIALGLIFLGILVGFNTIVAPAVNTGLPAGSLPWFPFLFITIACGAISGFHSLVSSGTTSKQIDNEADARYIGYGGAMGEGTLALAAILACTAGLGAAGAWNESYATYDSAAANALPNFTQGVGTFIGNLGIPVEIGITFAAVVAITFAGTSLDTGVRLHRYVVQEIGEIVGARSIARNITLGTTIAVLLGTGLALFPAGGGEEVGAFAYGELWRLFGTTNQLTAGLALAVIAIWLMARGRNPLAAIVPLVFLVAMTAWALILQLGQFFAAGDFLLLALDAVIFILSVWLMVEAIAAARRIRANRNAPPAETSNE